MKTFTTFLLILLIANQYVIAQEKFNAEITYINNEGFMISNNNSKIVIDGLYYYSYGNGIPNTDPIVLNKIMNNETPFDNTRLHLVTHNHADHYNITMMTNYLKNNPQSVFVGDSTMVKPMISKFPGQLFNTNPSKYVSVDTVINGFPLSVYNLIHDTGYRIYNVGYLVDIDGLKIFHSGDNTLEDTTEYIKYNIDTIAIDIAFINYNALLKSSSNSNFYKRHLHAKYIILMHLPDGQINSVKSKVAELGEGFPPIFVFSASMEKISLTDSMFYINQMPKLTSTIKDTTILLNSALTIKIPTLFTDPDNDDSLSYSASGLPKGLVFNAPEMSITGTPEKAGNSSVKITATDKSLCANNLTFKITVKDPTDIRSEKTSGKGFYPNPAKNQLWFEQLPGENKVIRIFDLLGRKKMETPFLSNPVNISELKKGTYLVTLSGADKTTNYKIIKE
jgi:L-ascorbate metabolism protein UlaG (beta-lactamase superfamily)